MRNAIARAGLVVVAKLSLFRKIFKGIMPLNIKENRCYTNYT